MTTLAFWIGQVVGAVGGIAVGRIIDRHGPRAVMTAGSTLAVPAPSADRPGSYERLVRGRWSLAGVAMSAVFYTPAFSAITHLGGARALSGLLTVTLGCRLRLHRVWSIERSAGRDDRLGVVPSSVLAGVFAVLTIPSHWFGS